MVYWNNTDIEAAVIGGALIAISSSFNMYSYGRSPSLSKIFNNLIRFNHGVDDVWNFSFLLGFLTIPFWIYTTSGNSIHLFGKVFTTFDSYSMNTQLSIFGWILSGFLVGFG